MFFRVLGTQTVASRQQHRAQRQEAEHTAWMDTHNGLGEQTGNTFAGKVLNPGLDGVPSGFYCY